ncbi:MAG: N-acetylmuramoyl-L-alanine amidase [Calditrichaeota bacterium]|nr:MAG: N-acetylmuramoyl-L-alanine amidase [Calditrichota bacterium]
MIFHKIVLIANPVFFMRISGHLLEDITVVNSPNHGAAFKKGRPDTIVIHYTASATGSQAIRTLTNPRVKASAHVVIDRDGSLTQLVPFDTIAWHAGSSAYRNRKGLNRYSIGIELVNAGWLRKSGEEYISDFGRVYPREEVIYAVHANPDVPFVYWHKYTDAQLDAAESLCALLIDTYPIRFLLGHDEIAPQRKQDPGPAFPLDDFRRRLLGMGVDLHQDKGPETLPVTAWVSATKLNIREAPSLKAAKVARPLTFNQEVTVLEQQGDWLRVSTRLEGWVHSDYVQTPSKGKNSV